jgi:hypothetical protein
MTNFMGTIYIEAGAMEATGPGRFGPASASAGELWILDGASLIVNPIYGECANYGMQIWNRVHVTGTGFYGVGAIRRITTYYNGNNAVNGGETFKGSMTFEGDTLINNGNTTVGLGDWVFTATGGAYYLNGHTLTFAHGGAYKINKAQIYAGDELAAINLGNGSTIGFFQIQSGFTLHGDSRNVFTVNTNSMLYGYNSGNMTTPWTLNLEKGSSVKLGGSDGANYWNTSAKTAHQWQGPINVNGNITVDCNTTLGNMHFSAVGPMHGPGGIFVNRGYLNLFNPSNDFTGPIWLNPVNVKCRCGLAFWDPEAWPSNNTHVVAVTNSEINLAADTGTCRLPPLAFHVANGYTNAAFAGVGAGVAPSLRKTGANVLDITVPLMVTGRTELAEGSPFIDTPAVYSLAPGLYESIHRTDLYSVPNSVTKAYYTDGTIAETNGITSYPMLSTKTTNISKNPPYVYGNWTSNMFARYEGYIWNRNPAPTRYGFALAFCAKGKLLIDDQLVFEGQGNWYYLRTNTVELSSGPHKFDLRLYTTTYSTSGARYDPNKRDYRFEGETLAETEVHWSESGKGFVWREGEAMPLSVDYVVPANGTITGLDGGDGFVFTRDTTTLDTIRSTTTFSNLICAAGTKLALARGEQELFVPKFEGVTDMTNGNLRIEEAWTVRAADVMANGVLEVEGALTFGEGARLFLDQDDAHLRHGEYIIAAADSIVGMPQYVPASANARGWRLSSGTDIQGRQTIMLTWSSGTLLSIR